MIFKHKVSFVTISQQVATEIWDHDTGIHAICILMYVCNISTLCVSGRKISLTEY
jgi:hypothetical protein